MLSKRQFGGNEPENKFFFSSWLESYDLYCSLNGTDCPDWLGVEGIISMSYFEFTQILCAHFCVCTLNVNYSLAALIHAYTLPKSIASHTQTEHECQRISSSFYRNKTTNNKIDK